MRTKRGKDQLKKVTKKHDLRDVAKQMDETITRDKYNATVN